MVQRDKYKMDDPGSSLPERLSSACEEADALVLYFARHCPGEPDENAIKDYSQLVKALSDARTKPGEDSYHSLMTAYQALACHTFRSQEVHGRSIIDSTRKRKRWGEWIVDKRFRPVMLGILFFGSALLLQLLDTWIQASLAGTTEIGPIATSGTVGKWYATLLASCVPLLVPAAWGALGACTALAKRVSDRLTAMSYEENRMHGLSARIFLGAALALVLDILVFVEGPSAAGSAAAAANGADPGFGPIVGAFLAGLFVQPVYGAFEAMMHRISLAISPGSDGQRIVPRAAPPPPDAPQRGSGNS